MDIRSELHEMSCILKVVDAEKVTFDELDKILNDFFNDNPQENRIKTFEILKHFALIVQQNHFKGEVPRYLNIERYIASLLKRVKSDTCTLKTLLLPIVSRGKFQGKCVTIFRNRDGRFQSHGGKYFPHILSFQMWRDPDVSVKSQLQANKLCKCSFYDKNNLTCINPYHYDLSAERKEQLSILKAITCGKLASHNQAINERIKSYNLLYASEGDERYAPHNSVIKDPIRHSGSYINRAEPTRAHMVPVASKNINQNFTQPEFSQHGSLNITAPGSGILESPSNLVRESNIKYNVHSIANNVVSNSPQYLSRPSNLVTNDTNRMSFSATNSPNWSLQSINTADYVLSNNQFSSSAIRSSSCGMASYKSFQECEESSRPLSQLDSPLIQYNDNNQTPNNDNDSYMSAPMIRNVENLLGHVNRSAVAHSNSVTDDFSPFKYTYDAIIDQKLRTQHQEEINIRRGHFNSPQIPVPETINNVCTYPELDLEDYDHQLSLSEYSTDNSTDTDAISITAVRKKRKHKKDECFIHKVSSTKLLHYYNYMSLWRAKQSVETDIEEYLTAPLIPWCKITAKEMGFSRLEPYISRQSTGDIYVLTGPSNEATDTRFCIGIDEKVHSNQNTINELNKLGKGFLLRYLDDGTANMLVFSDYSMFVNGFYLDVSTNMCWETTIHKLPSKTQETIFKLSEFLKNARGLMNRHKLILQNSSHIDKEAMTHLRFSQYKSLLNELKKLTKIRISTTEWSGDRMSNTFEESPLTFEIEFLHATNYISILQNFLQRSMFTRIPDVYENEANC